MAKAKNNEFEMDKDQKSAFADLLMTKDLLAEIFGEGVQVTPSMVFDCHDRVFSYDDEDSQDLIVAELKASVELAAKLGLGADATFAVFDRVFEADDEDEDEDEE